MTAQRTARKRDWFDNQPGAWVMVMLPAAAGFIIGGPNLDTLWLLAIWALCYCVQFSAAHWFKAHVLAPLSATDDCLYRGTYRNWPAIPDYAYRHTALGSLIYSAGRAINAVLVVEEGALAVGQCGIGDCRVDDGHGNHVIRQRCQDGMCYSSQRGASLVRSRYRRRTCHDSEYAGIQPDI